MKNALLSVLTMFALLSCDGNTKGTFLKTVTSPHTQAQSVKKLQSVIKQKGLTLFETIDHKANATAVKMNLKPETVVVFGNPRMGTILMDCNPSMGLDLPLRVLVHTTYEGQTSFIYTNPEYWSLKHNIKDKKCLGIINKAAIALAEIIDEASQK